LKVLTLLGTRPEIIRLSRVIDRLDRLCEHVLVHTGQNFDHSLSDVFFDDLGVRSPDRLLELPRDGGFGARVGRLLGAAEAVLREQRPERLLVLGDTDSGLAAFVAKRLGIPVFHMEAGNRCFDDRVPEEVNRRVIDHSSDVLMPYTERSRGNLLREGVEYRRTFVTGNPIKEVLDRHEARVEHSDALDRLGLEPGGYLLLTAHRQETVDVERRLRSLADGVTRLAEEVDLPLVCALHPRTRDRLQAFGVPFGDDRVRVMPALGFFDFVRLERAARCVLTDSGTVQEECCIFGVPAVTVRDTTERPETVECGSNVLSGVDAEAISRCVHAALDAPPSWTPPREYLVDDVSGIVARIVLGHLDARTWGESVTGDPRDEQYTGTVEVDEAVRPDPAETWADTVR
jgi:UDP-N-acetylglucosamine 2-epimerase (non-hydrolysing)